MRGHKPVKTVYGKRAKGRPSGTITTHDDDDEPVLVTPSVVEKTPPSPRGRVGSALMGKEFHIPVVTTSGVRRPSKGAALQPARSPVTGGPSTMMASRRPAGSVSRAVETQSGSNEDEMEDVKFLGSSTPTQTLAKGKGKRKEQASPASSSPSRAKKQRLDSTADVPPLVKRRAEANNTSSENRSDAARPGTSAVPPVNSLKGPAPMDSEVLSPTKKRLSMNPRPTLGQSVQPGSSPSVPSTLSASPTTPVQSHIISRGPVAPEHLRGPQRGLLPANGKTASSKLTKAGPTSPGKATETVNNTKNSVPRTSTTQPVKPLQRSTAVNARPSTPPPRPTAIPVTPTPKPPRDLSALFETLPQSPAALQGTPSRTGIARGMSKRSPMKSSSRAVSEVPSMLLPATPIKSSPISHREATPPSSSQPSQPEATPPARMFSRTTSGASSTHKTYAKSRSFLMDSMGPMWTQSHSQPVSMSQGNSQDLGDMDVDGMMADLEVPTLPKGPDLDDLGLGQVTESYAEKAARWGIEEDIDEGLQDPADLRSISFQRTKGENRRFVDEVGFLLDGLKPGQALQVRRSSGLQLVEKMLDHEYIRRLKAMDAIGQSWDALRQAGGGGGDHLLDGTLFLFLALTTEDARNVEPLLSRMDDVVFAAVKGLEGKEEDDVLAKARVPKSERSLLKTLKSLVAKSNLDIEEVNLSTRRLVSISLKAFAALTPTPLTLPILAPTCKSLISELKPFTKRLQGYMEGRSLVPGDADEEDDDDGEFLDLVHTDNCLHVLEVFTLRGNKDEDSSEAMDVVREHADELSKHLLALSIGTHIISRRDDEKLSSAAANCLISSLRVLVNLSSTEARWCHAVLSHPTALPGVIRLIVHSQREVAMSDSMHGRENSHDVLCLALALLTNLVEQVPEARDGVRETLYSPACQGERQCTYACQCDDRVSALLCLVQLYAAKSMEAEECAAENQAKEGAEAAFVAGHCSVLLSILALDKPANVTIIIQALPGADQAEKLDGLLTAVKDFTDAQRDVKQALDGHAADSDRAEQDGEDEDEDGNGDGMAEAPARAEDTGAEGSDAQDKGKTVVAQIIDMLEDLRDAA